MDEEDKSKIPKWQNLYDNQWFLLIAGIVVMFAFYTIWGMFEVFSLPPAELP